nr:MAG TPA: hypothetical protein [Herelleviridae sp.]
MTPCFALLILRRSLRIMPTFSEFLPLRLISI